MNIVKGIKDLRIFVDMSFHDAIVNARFIG